MKMAISYVTQKFVITESVTLAEISTLEIIESKRNLFLLEGQIFSPNNTFS